MARVRMATTRGECTDTAPVLIVDADRRIGDACRVDGSRADGRLPINWIVCPDGKAGLVELEKAVAGGRWLSLAVLVDGPEESAGEGSWPERMRRVQPDLDVIVVGSPPATDPLAGTPVIHYWEPPVDPVQLVSYVRALAEKGEAERRLRTTHARVQHLLAASPIVLYSCQPTGEHRLTFVSENLRDHFGHCADDFIADPAAWFDTIHPEDQRCVIDRFSRLADSDGLAIEYRVRHADGLYRWVNDRARLLRDATGNPAEIVGSWIDISERRHAEEQIRYLAYYDDLTGLPNRTLMRELLEHAVAAAERYGRRLAVMSLDVDHFKRVVDMFGHAAADSLLNHVSKRLVASVRASDQIFRPRPSETDGEDETDAPQQVARLGGDEFVIILSEVSGPEDAAAAARRVHAALTAPIALAGEEVTISASIGIANYPSDGTTAEILLRNADTALHSAKEHGRNCFHFYTHKLNEQTARRFSIETRLRRALEDNEFILHYQPIIDLERAVVRGAEALIRWQQPDEGLISPAEFIPVAEETGLIIPISEWVFSEACTQMARWRQEGLPLSIVSVNVSSVQFSQRTLTDAVVKALQTSGLDPACLELELTEGILISDVDASRRILNRLRELGVHVCVDDFGTGYSSLAYLKSFPLSSLKVPRCFIHDLTFDLSDAAIVSATVALGHNLGLQVVAEGVETREQLAILQRHQTDFVQGFLFSKAVPPAEFVAWINRWPEISRRIAGPSPSVVREAWRTPTATTAGP